MFTGIVEELGHLTGRDTRQQQARLTVRCRFASLQLGESICVSGVCLTVDQVVDGGFQADVSAETLSRSTLGELRIHAPVNLERALLPTSRLGGHFVGGHVDARAKLISRETVGNSERMEVELPGVMASLVAVKGSVAIDGVSLTVNEVFETSFSIMVIPHTLARTTLAKAPVGIYVNLEGDVLARYIARQLALLHPKTSKAVSSSDDTMMASLERSGFLGR